MQTIKYLLRRYGNPPTLGRSDLARVFAKQGMTRGAIVGTWNGGFADQLCSANPKLKLIGVDINNSTPRKAVPGNTKLLTMKSLEAAKKIVDASLDFVYLDTNSDLAATVADIAAWSTKVKPGGIMSGDDYYRYRAHTGVQTYEAVNAYVQAYHVGSLFLTKDRVHSWFWFKA